MRDLNWDIDPMNPIRDIERGVKAIKEAGEKHQSVKQQQYQYFVSRKNGYKTVDLKKGCGYYIERGLFPREDVGVIKEFKMKSGVISIFELLEFETFSDPYDMTKSSVWMLLGDKDLKPISECSYFEFIELYGHRFTYE